MVRIALARTDDEVLKCVPVMGQLRRHISAAQLFERVRRQQAGGYELVYLEADGEICAVAGFRVLENLAWGRYLYVDDLVTAEAVRAQGWGRQLMDWLVGEARRSDCDQLHLDSGVQRFPAHRFYLRQRMDLTCHHFALRLR